MSIRNSFGSNKEVIIIYEIEKLYPVDLGPVFTVDGYFAGNAYAGINQTKSVLIKNSFIGTHAIFNITPLLDRGYRFLQFPYNPPGVPGVDRYSNYGTI